MDFPACGLPALHPRAAYGKMDMPDKIYPIKRGLLNMRTKQARMTLWTGAVYLLSFLCYVPVLLQRLGAAVPGGLLSLRYVFVLIPAAVTVFFLMRGRQVKHYLAARLKGISLRELALCAAAALAGVLVTCGYSLTVNTNLYASAYPSIGALAASCGYLFLTALAEEAAWRGFFFHNLAAGGKRMRAAVLTGAVWGIWHLPMWILRNSLGLPEVLPLLVWVLLVSIALGMLYGISGSILSAALLHMLCNVCFLAPTAWNSAALSLCILAAVCEKSFKKSRKPS